MDGLAVEGESCEGTRQREQLALIDGVETLGEEEILESSKTNVGLWPQSGNFQVLGRTDTGSVFARVNLPAFTETG